MILLAGVAAERPMAMAAEAAAGLGVEAILVDQRHLDATEIVVESSDAGLAAALITEGRTVALDGIAGAYVRLMDPTETAGPEGTGAARSRAFVDLLSGWLDVAPHRVANRPAAMASNSSKPFQSQLIAGAGFDVPATLVTNDPDQVRRFAGRYGRLVYKSTSSERSVVAELTEERRRDLNRVRWLPTQFQELVEGVDVRVHVVGREVFACEARWGGIDYRYAGRQGPEVPLVPVELDGGLAGRCVALARALGLCFAGIDLKRTATGRTVCFEVNPSPAYSWFEDETGQPIARALVSHLAGLQP